MKRKYSKGIRIVLSMQLVALFLLGNNAIFAQEITEEEAMGETELTDTFDLDKITVEPQNVIAESDVALQAQEATSNTELVHAENRATTEPVRIKGTSTTYSTLKEAVEDISGATPVTLEITDDIVEMPNTNINVNANITLEAVGGNYSIKMEMGSINVQNGNTLILGDGIGSNILTIHSNRRVLNVTNGHIEIRDGIELISDNQVSNIVYAVMLTGTNTTGKISGGVVRSSDEAVHIVGGAKISTISGGKLIGHNSSLFMGGVGSKIELISGGYFQNEENNRLKRANFYVDEGSTIDEISGGEFIANSYAALLIRGGWIENISGGSFTAYHGVFSEALSARGVMIASTSNTKTGIGEISGGQFSGDLGLWTVYENSTVSKITGGKFSGVRGLQVDAKTKIGSISGATITGEKYGLLNVGIIEEIKENTLISGEVGIWNNGSNSHIITISGGNIQGTSGSAIKNEGTIDLISSGTFIGQAYAIDNYAINPSPKKLGTISGGNFYGKTNEAIRLVETVMLEPSINTVPGVSRFWGKGGVIFNDENLVTYPDSYYMSSLTKQVTDIAETNFKYLTKSFEIKYMPNGASGTMSPTSKEYNTNATVLDNAFTNTENQFLGWNTQADGNGTSYAEGEVVLLENDIVLYAQWQSNNPVNPIEPPINPKENEKPSIEEKTPSDKQAIKNKNSSVQTGDNNTSIVMLSLLVISISGACLLLILKKRNKISS